MEVCKTDMQKIIKYLNDAAIMYDNHPGQRNVCRAWVIRQLIKYAILGMTFAIAAIVLLLSTDSNQE